MKLFAEIYGIDVALLPIGGYFTADVKQAIEACKLIKPNIENVEKLGVKAIILKPGKNRNIKHKILLRRRMF